jgi:hypothetical protein
MNIPYSTFNESAGRSICVDCSFTIAMHEEYVLLSYVRRFEKEMVPSQGVHGGLYRMPVGTHSL